MTIEEQVAELTKKVEASEKLVDQVTKLQEDLKTTSEFVTDASVLISVISQNADLKGKVKDAIEHYDPSKKEEPKKEEPKEVKFDPYTGEPIKKDDKKEEPKKEEPKKETPMTDPRVDDIDMKNRKDIIAAVEKRFGYDKLAEDKQKTMRSAVGKQLRAWGQDIQQVPVSALEDTLKDAYLMVGMKTVEGGNKPDVAALVAAHDADPGALPAMGGGKSEETTTELSADGQKWAKKLEVPEDKVQQRLKELTETGVARYTPPEKKDDAGKKTPSGNPNEPTNA